jgi:hypothetical protein
MRYVLQDYLIEGAQLTKRWGFPILQPCHEVPEKLIKFSKIKETKDFKQFVHFYENDNKILPFGRNPHKYFSQLCQFSGVIGCDFSVYRDMPFSEQVGQTFWNRALTFWLQNHNITVIPNIRYGDESTYEFCFDGIPEKSIISIGTHGCTKSRDDISFHIKGISETIKQLKPELILFYGAVVEDLEALLLLQKIPFKKFNSDISEFFKKRMEESGPLLEGLDIGGA